VDVNQRGTHWTDFYGNLVLGASIKKIHQETKNFVKIWQKISATLREERSTFYFCLRHQIAIKQLSSSETV